MSSVFIKILGILLLITVLMACYYFWPASPLDISKKIDRILVCKSKHTLTVFSNGEALKTYTIAIGKGHGKKEFEGDKKTPEGIYTINDKNPNSAYYLNLGVSYPNAQDKAHAKKFNKSAGSLIKIHGLKNGKGYIGKFHRITDWTLGCIAVTNKEMKELYDHVPIGTVIEIIP